MPDGIGNVIFKSLSSASPPYRIPIKNYGISYIYLLFLNISYGNNFI
nr:MAG TPA: hypothetical protein [Caudoviricetes sp.]